MALGASALVAVVAGCGHAPVGGGGGNEVVWSGEVRIARLETIPEGTTLRILPGTRVVFEFVDRDGDGDGDAGIEARGVVRAEGTRERPIRFVGAREGAGGWDEVRVEDAPAATFSWCEFAGAQWGLHVHRTPTLVAGCTFAGNAGGLRFRGGPVTVAYSRFAGNGIGIRYWEGDPEIVGNVFDGNGTGVFVREGSADSLVTGNDFRASADYHLKLGEAQAADVAAPGNWWGTTAEADIEAAIFDREDVSYLGRVVWRPAAVGPRRGAD